MLPHNIKTALSKLPAFRVDPQVCYNTLCCNRQLVKSRLGCYQLMNNSKISRYLDDKNVLTIDLGRIFVDRLQQEHTDVYAPCHS
jgi:hypothetical protein